MNRTRAVVLLTVFAVALASPSQAPAALYVTNIAYAKRDVSPQDYYADDVSNNYYQVVGRVTSPSYATNATELFIQDTNDNVGILVLTASFPTNFPLGAAVTAVGRISQANGLRAIGPEFVTHLTNNGLPAVSVPPVCSAVTTILANAETFEGTYIIVSNVNIVSGTWPEWNRSSTLVITDLTGQINLRIDTGTDADGQPAPTNTFQVKGILSQYDTSAPPDGGYEILVRYYSDLVQNVGQEPPALYIENSGTLYVAVSQPLAVSVLGQDRNAADVLVLGTNQSPAGSAFTDFGNREGRLTWTPDASFVGTTNTVTFSVSDGTATNTASIDIYVLSEEEANIVVNEIHWDPHPSLGDANGDGFVDTTQDEFVEIVNNNAGPVDISGWVLRKPSAILFTLPHTVVSGKAAVVVFGGGIPVGTFGNSTVYTPTSSWNGLTNPDNTNAVLNLLNSNGVPISSYDYNSFGTPDQSITRNPDFTGDYVLHTTAISFLRYSPGTMADGRAFSGSGVTNMPPLIEPIPNKLVSVGSRIVIPVNSLDPEWNTITLSVSNAPASASFADNGDGTGVLAYTGLVAEAGSNFIIGVYAGDGVTNATTTFVLSVLETKFSGLMINEYLPDPDVLGAYVDANNDGVTNAPDDEFVEILNNSTGSLDMAGCMIFDAAQRRHTFFSQIVPTGGSIVVFGGGSIASFTNPPAQVASTGGLGINNDTDTITLYSPSTSIIDQVSHSIQISAQSWTRFPDGQGGCTNEHLVVSGYALRASPGLRVDGMPFLPNMPSVTITNPPSNVTVSNSVDSYDVQGTVSTTTVGQLIWTNSLTGIAGTIAVATNWTIGGVALATGVNSITVSGTNSVGLSASDSVSITRLAPPSGECGVIISEYVEGSSYNKAVEIYNGTGSSIDLLADEYYLMIYFNASTTAGQSYALSGTIASGDAYVVVAGSADATLLSYADELAGTTAWFNGDDAVELRSGGTNGPVVDSIGQVGVDPGSAWGTEPNTTVNHTLRRKATVDAGDTVSTDAFDPATEWDAFAQDTFDGLGTHTNNCPAGLPDQDGDGMSDDYEITYFGGATNGVPNIDSDTDLVVNLDEYYSDTVPVGAIGHTNFLKVDAISNVNQRFITFLSFTSRLYSFQAASNLVGPNAWADLVTDIPGSNAPISFTDTNFVPWRSYRIKARVP